MDEKGIHYLQEGSGYPYEKCRYPFSSRAKETKDAFVRQQSLYAAK
jgi:hypothetical protein